MRHMASATDVQVKVRKTNEKDNEPHPSALPPSSPTEKALPRAVCGTWHLPQMCRRRINIDQLDKVLFVCYNKIKMEQNNDEKRKLHINKYVYDI